MIDGETMIGGGSLPGGTLPTRLMAIGREASRKQQNIAQALSRRLCYYEKPIVGRISGNILFLDPRSVLPEEDELVLQALQELAVNFRQT